MYAWEGLLEFSGKASACDGRTGVVVVVFEAAAKGAFHFRAGELRDGYIAGLGHVRFGATHGCSANLHCWVHGAT